MEEPLQSLTRFYRDFRELYTEIPFSFIQAFSNQMNRMNFLAAILLIITKVTKVVSNAVHPFQLNYLINNPCISVIFFYYEVSFDLHFLSNFKQLRNIKMLIYQHNY